jgi:hypothetical protein
LSEKLCSKNFVRKTFFVKFDTKLCPKNFVLLLLFPKKLPKVNNCSMGELSPNPVTLCDSSQTNQKTTADGIKRRTQPKVVWLSQPAAQTNEAGFFISPPGARCDPRGELGPQG